LSRVDILAEVSFVLTKVYLRTQIFNRTFPFSATYGCNCPS